MEKANVKVLFVSAEVSPYAKTGGLGDVAGSLPSALKRLGVDVRVAMPKYACISAEQIKDAVWIGDHTVKLEWRNQQAGIYKLQGDVPIYLIQNEYYFNRQGLYGYGDDHERFSFFCKAVLEMLPRIGFQPDIIHCNDWHSGPISLLLKEAYHAEGFYEHIKTLFTIHNLQYQGVFPKDTLKLLGLPDYYFDSEKIEFYGQINFMKAGLLYADGINTVSNTYAKEIQTPQYGYGLDGVLRKQRHLLHGILNGIDYDKYNPQTDPRIYETFDVLSLEGKSRNKEMLQAELNLPIKDVPVIGLISRLADQKGFDLIAQVLNQLMEEELQIIVLGTGEYRYEEMFREIAKRFPEKLSANITFNETLAQKIYGGSDLFLMPSLFEPCGLGQIFSLRYGTIPIVRRTGGLTDTVFPFDRNTGIGNGFAFEEYSGTAMLGAVKEAISLYASDSEQWKKLIQNAMKCNYSWSESAQKYSSLYQML